MELSSADLQHILQNVLLQLSQTPDLLQNVQGKRCCLLFVAIKLCICHGLLTNPHCFPSFEIYCMFTLYLSSVPTWQNWCSLLPRSSSNCLVCFVWFQACSLIKVCILLRQILTLIRMNVRLKASDNNLNKLTTLSRSMSLASTRLSTSSSLSGSISWVSDGHWQWTFQWRNRLPMLWEQLDIIVSLIQINVMRFT